MSDVNIRLADDSVHGIFNQYMIPYWMTQYLDGESVIYVKRTDETVYVPHVVACQLCDRNFNECTKPTALLCQNARINREFGYVAKICIDCFYWIENQRGRHEDTPKTVRKTLEAGHQPKRFDYLVN